MTISSLNQPLRLNPIFNIANILSGSDPFVPTEEMTLFKKFPPMDTPGVASGIRLIARLPKEMIDNVGRLLLTIGAVPLSQGQVQLIENMVTQQIPMVARDHSFEIKQSIANIDYKLKIFLMHQYNILNSPTEFCGSTVRWIEDQDANYTLRLFEDVLKKYSLKPEEVFKDCLGKKVSLPKDWDVRTDCPQASQRIRDELKEYLFYLFANVMGTHPSNVYQVKQFGFINIKNIFEVLEQFLIFSFGDRKEVGNKIDWTIYKSLQRKKMFAGDDQTIGLDPILGYLLDENRKALPDIYPTSSTPNGVAQACFNNIANIEHIHDPDSLNYHAYPKLICKYTKGIFTPALNEERALLRSFLTTTEYKRYIDEGNEIGWVFKVSDYFRRAIENHLSDNQMAFSFVMNLMARLQGSEVSSQSIENLSDFLLKLIPEPKDDNPLKELINALRSKHIPIEQIWNLIEICGIFHQSLPASEESQNIKYFFGIDNGQAALQLKVKLGENSFHLLRPFQPNLAIESFSNWLNSKKNPPDLSMFDKLFPNEIFHNEVDSPLKSCIEGITINLHGLTLAGQIFIENENPFIKKLGVLLLLSAASIETNTPALETLFRWAPEIHTKPEISILGFLASLKSVTSHNIITQKKFEPFLTIISNIKKKKLKNERFFRVWSEAVNIVNQTPALFIEEQKIDLLPTPSIKQNEKHLVHLQELIKLGKTSVALEQIVKLDILSDLDNPQNIDILAQFVAQVSFQPIEKQLFYKIFTNKGLINFFEKFPQQQIMLLEKYLIFTSLPQPKKDQHFINEVLETTLKLAFASQNFAYSQPLLKPFLNSFKNALECSDSIKKLLMEKCETLFQVFQDAYLFNELLEFTNLLFTHKIKFSFSEIIINNFYWAVQSCLKVSSDSENVLKIDNLMKRFFISSQLDPKFKSETQFEICFEQITHLHSLGLSGQSIKWVAHCELILSHSFSSIFPIMKNYFAKAKNDQKLFLLKIWILFKPTNGIDIKDKINFFIELVSVYCNFESGNFDYSILGGVIEELINLKKNIPKSKKKFNFTNLVNCLVRLFNQESVEVIQSLSQILIHASKEGLLGFEKQTNSSLWYKYCTTLLDKDSILAGKVWLEAYSQQVWFAHRNDADYIKMTTTLIKHLVKLDSLEAYELAEEILKFSELENPILQCKLQEKKLKAILNFLKNQEIPKKDFLRFGKEFLMVVKTSAGSVKMESLKSFSVIVNENKSFDLSLEAINLIIKNNASGLEDVQNEIILFLKTFKLSHSTKCLDFIKLHLKLFLNINFAVEACQVISNCLNSKDKLIQKNLLELGVVFSASKINWLPLFENISNGNDIDLKKLAFVVYRILAPSFASFYGDECHLSGIFILTDLVDIHSSALSKIFTDVSAITNSIPDKFIDSEFKKISHTILLRYYTAIETVVSLINSENQNEEENTGVILKFFENLIEIKKPSLEVLDTVILDVFVIYIASLTKQIFLFSAIIDHFIHIFKHNNLDKLNINWNEIIHKFSDYLLNFKAPINRMHLDNLELIYNNAWTISKYNIDTEHLMTKFVASGDPVIVNIGGVVLRNLISFYQHDFNTFGSAKSEVHKFTTEYKIILNITLKWLLNGYKHSNDPKILASLSYITGLSISTLLFSKYDIEDIILLQIDIMITRNRSSTAFDKAFLDFIVDKLKRPVSKILENKLFQLAIQNIIKLLPNEINFKDYLYNFMLIYLAKENLNSNQQPIRELLHVIIYCKSPNKIVLVNQLDKFVEPLCFMIDELISFDSLNFLYVSQFLGSFIQLATNEFSGTITSEIEYHLNEPAIRYLHKKFVTIFKKFLFTHPVHDNLLISKHFDLCKKILHDLKGYEEIITFVNTDLSDRFEIEIYIHKLLSNNFISTYLNEKPETGTILANFFVNRLETNSLPIYIRCCEIWFNIQNQLNMSVEDIENIYKIFIKVSTYQDFTSEESTQPSILNCLSTNDHFKQKDKNEKWARALKEICNFTLTTFLEVLELENNVAIENGIQNQNEFDESIENIMDIHLIFLHNNFISKPTEIIFKMNTLIRLIQIVRPNIFYYTQMIERLLRVLDDSMWIPQMKLIYLNKVCASIEKCSPPKRFILCHWFLLRLQNKKIIAKEPHLFSSLVRNLLIYESNFLSNFSSTAYEEIIVKINSIRTRLESYDEYHFEKMISVWLKTLFLFIHTKQDISLLDIFQEELDNIHFEDKELY